MITEDQLEQLAIQWFQDTGWSYLPGKAVSPDPEADPLSLWERDGVRVLEREDFRAVVLKGRLADAVSRLNPKLSPDAVAEVVHVVLTPEHISLVHNNRDFHRMLLNGVKVEYTAVSEAKETLSPALSQKEREHTASSSFTLAPWERAGERVVDHAMLIDFNNPSNNDFLVVNQFTVTGMKKPRRPDLVCFVNGLPLGLIELKNPADTQADVWKAFSQLQTYKEEISDLLVFNEALVVSDGMNARVGSLTASEEWFMPWRTISNENDKPQVEFELEKIVRGFFRPDLFDLRPRANPAGDLRRSSMSLRSILDYVRYFILFEDDGGKLIKKIAGYHQFHGVREAVRVTMIAAKPVEEDGKVREDRAAYGKEVIPGSKKAGVFWHTQGSGKSISMCCYAGMLLQQPEMNNPTLVVVTDRNDLDGQLFTQFCSAKDLLKQTPEQAESRTELRQMLAARQSGGIIFTTIQKFTLVGDERIHPSLCERTNVVVISDEAHRSQYGTKAKLNTKTGSYVYGYAKHLRDALPGASFIGFTGTPIEKADANTQAVFGDYV